MKEQKIKELSQEIFECVHGYSDNVNEWTIDEVAETIECIQSLVKELQIEVGNPTSIQKIGYNPNKQSAKADASYSKKKKTMGECDLWTYTT